MDIKSQVVKMDTMVAQGAIVEAVETFFASDAYTSDYNGLKTSSKPEMVEKMTGFVQAIDQVVSITHNQTVVESNYSTSEFTFNFLMKDQTEILWHEIIARSWNKNGLVIKEQYFKA